MFCNQDISLNFVSHIGFGVLACSYCIKRLLHLRICIAVSNLVLILWALTALPTASCVSTSAWNSLFFIINVFRAWEEYQKEKQTERGDIEMVTKTEVFGHSGSPRRRLSGLAEIAPF